MFLERLIDAFLDGDVLLLLEPGDDYSFYQGEKGGVLGHERDVKVTFHPSGGDKVFALVQYL